MRSSFGHLKRLLRCLTSRTHENWFEALDQPKQMVSRRASPQSGVASWCIQSHARSRVRMAKCRPRWLCSISVEEQEREGKALVFKVSTSGKMSRPRAIRTGWHQIQTCQLALDILDENASFCAEERNARRAFQVHTFQASIMSSNSRYAQLVSLYDS